MKMDVSQIRELANKLHQSRSAVAMVLDSYNDFVNRGIPEVFRGVQFRIKGYRVQFEKAELTKPAMFPTEAHRGSMDYFGTLLVNVYINGQKRLENIKLCQLPIMVQSQYCRLYNLPKEQYPEAEECPFSPGGYFVVGGNEKSLGTYEKLFFNEIYVVRNKERPHDIVAELRAQDRDFMVYMTEAVMDTTEIGTSKAKLDFFAVHLPSMPQKEYINAVTLLRLILRYGYNMSDEDAMTRAINYFKGITLKHMSQTMAHQMRFLVEQTIDVARTQEELPELDVMKVMRELVAYAPNITKKLQTLGQMFIRVGSVFLGIETLDDRDSYVNKMMETPGNLLLNLFATLFRTAVEGTRRNQRGMIVDMAKYMDEDVTNLKAIQNVIQKYGQEHISRNIRSSMSTGNWGIKSANMREGVSQPFNRTSLLDMYSQVTRVLIKGTGKGKQVDARQLHATSYGYICASDTPEGAKCGLIKHFAVTADVTLKRSPTPVYDLVRPLLQTSGIPLYVNFLFTGYVPESVYETLKREKTSEQGRLHPYTGIVLKRHVNPYDTWKTLSLYTTEGRLVRPVLRVEDHELVLMKRMKEEPHLLERRTWWELVRMGVVEYLDAREAEQALIAPFPQQEEDNQGYLQWQSIHQLLQRKHYTHMELQAESVMGLAGLVMPFAQMNTGARITYTAGQTKQNTGVTMLSFQKRADNSLRMIHYGQKPLVTTQMTQRLGMEEMPFGVNVNVMIGTYTGFTMEDAIIMNKASVDRGLFNSDTYSVFTTSMPKTQTLPEGQYPRLERGVIQEREEVTAPIQRIMWADPETDQTFESITEAIHQITQEQQASVAEGVREAVDTPQAIEERLEQRYITVEKMYSRETVIRPRDMLAVKTWKEGGEVFEDPLKAVATRTGVVDRVFETDRGSEKVVKVVVRYMNIPQIGDKFACVDDETEVLTEHGFIPFEDLTYAHKVAMLENNNVVYTHPQFIWMYNGPNEMLEVDNDTVSLCVTPNHNMYVRDKGLVRADQLSGIVPFRNDLDKPQESFSYEDYVDNKDVLGHIQQKALHHGTSARGTYWGGQWHVEIGKHIPCGTLKRVPYQGKVHCCTVPTGIIYVRRRGKCCWTGNSRYSQKGTVGLMLPEVDMPYDINTGVRPDIIINPHAFPSRMTIGMFIEMLIGKAATIMGNEKRYQIKNLQNFYIPVSQLVPYNLEQATIQDGQVQFSSLTVEDQNTFLATHEKQDWIPVDLLTSAYTVTPNMIQQIEVGKENHQRRVDVVEFEDLSMEDQQRYREAHNQDVLDADWMVAHPDPQPPTVYEQMVDATPFKQPDMQLIRDELRRVGFEESGNVRMVDGRTGELMTNPMFFGVCYYMALKHMVADKYQARGTGMTQLMTRQAIEGRTRNGGIRFGEMETQALMAWGASGMLLERLRDVSDYYEATVCRTCGDFCYSDLQSHEYVCKNCGQVDPIIVSVPYSWILLTNELAGMGINVQNTVVPIQRRIQQERRQIQQRTQPAPAPLPAPQPREEEEELPEEL